tara:strand:+ start:2199 stop:2393 length:195 start_codon:yes stop_codon:yes gene_type:complete
MSYWFKHLEFNGNRFVLKRTIKESTLPSNVSSEDLKAYFMVNTILKKDGVFYLCESIDDAEIIY